MVGMSRLNINKKIFGAVLVALLFLALVLGTVIWGLLTKMTGEELKKRGLTIANHIATSSSDYILTDDYYATYLLIEQTQQANEDIRYIMVFNNNQTLVGHSFSGDLPSGIMNTHLPNGTNKDQVAALTSNEGNIQDILSPIENGDVGYVRVGMAESRTQAMILGKIGELIIATILVCIAAAGIVYYVTRLITRSINNLVEVATGISEGNLSLRANEASNDEVGKLARAFNEMTDSLISSNTEVEKLLNELQEKDGIRDMLISKLLSAQEDERRRISRELHDETSQALTSLMVTMRVMANEAKDDEQHTLLTSCREVTASILREIRDLAVELRPPILDDMGLIPAIRKYVHNFEDKYGLEVVLTLPSNECTMDSHKAVALYRILQESMTNVVKHTSASKIQITLTLQNQHIQLMVRDNGHGIQLQDFEKARQQDRIGIYGMRERAVLLGGSFHLESKSEGGTELSVSLPQY